MFTSPLNHTNSDMFGVLENLLGPCESEYSYGAFDHSLCKNGWQKRTCKPQIGFVCKSPQYSPYVIQDPEGGFMGAYDLFFGVIDPHVFKQTL